MYRSLIVALLLLAPTVGAQAPPVSGDTIFVADRYFTDSTTIGAAIVAKFWTREARAALLSLDATVTILGTRTWRVDDVLVTLGIDGNGVTASWYVAGPRSVVEAHIARVEALARDRDTIYGHAVRRLVVRCACD